MCIKIKHTTNTQSFLRQCKACVRFVLVGLLLLAGLLHCTPEIVQLDPGFIDASQRNEGTSSQTDGGQQTAEKNSQSNDAGPKDSQDSLTDRDNVNDGVSIRDGENNVSLPDTNGCQAAPTSIRQYGELSAKKDNLIVGRLGPSAAGKTIDVSLPSGWLVAPNSIVADEEGTFAFVLSCGGKAAAPGVYLRISSGKDFCYRMPIQVTNNESLKELRSVSRQSCEEGDSSETIKFKAQGNVRADPIVISTDKKRATVESVRMVLSELRITVRCRKRGSLFLLVGSDELAGAVIPLRVEDD